MSAATADRQGRARARAAALAARDEALPRAICAACGGVVGAGQGVSLPRPSWGAYGAQEDDDRQRQGLPLIAEWSRRHDACATTPGIVQQIVGGEVSAEIASDALSEASRARGREILAQHRYADEVAATRAYRQPKPRAWAHLDDADRARLRRAVDRARAEVEPRRCSAGACAWCGCSHSIGWRTSPETWSDGTAAPLCATCAAVWDRRTAPTDREGLRAAALEALSGAAGWTGLDLMTFSDVAGDDHAGQPIGWTYAPQPLAELRERARLTWPAGVGGDYAARAAQAARDAREAAQAAADAAAESERLTAARAAGWPI